METQSQLSFTLTDRVIITGGDGCGKTTLLKKLTEDADGPQLGPSLGHGGGPPKDLTDVMKRLRDFSMARVGIVDRFIAIDEPVYQKALNRESVVPQHYLDEWIGRHQPKIIFALTAAPKISRKYKAHKSPELVEQVVNHYMMILNLYIDRLAKLQNEYGLQILRYNFDKDPKATGLFRKMRELGWVKGYLSDIH